MQYCIRVYYRVWGAGKKYYFCCIDSCVIANVFVPCCEISTTVFISESHSPSNHCASLIYSISLICWFFSKVRVSFLNFCDHMLYLHAWQRQPVPFPFFFSICCGVFLFPSSIEVRWYHKLNFQGTRLRLFYLFSQIHATHAFLD